MKLTILMPCLNEAETLEICIIKAQQWIKKSEIEAEILISDNGSTDGSQKIAENLGARVVNAPYKGYGAALFYGATNAKGEYIIMGDSDDSYDFSKLDLFIDKLDEGYDLVMGNRFSGGIEPKAMPWKNRYIGNPTLSWIGKILFKIPIGDFHCGLRGFRRTAFLEMDLRTTGMEFASEMVIKASLMKMKIAEVPTTLSKDGRSRPPHLRPWQDGWRHLKFMLLFNPKWLFIIPGSILFLFCTILYIFIFIKPLNILGINLDINSLLYMECGSIIGLLFFSSGHIIRLFAIRENLLPNNKFMSFIQKSSILEYGSIFSILILGIAFYICFDTILYWSKNNFGQLIPGALVKKISLSIGFFMIGAISLIFSLTCGFLALPMRKNKI